MPSSDLWGPSATTTQERPSKPKRLDREGQQHPDPLDDLTAALDRTGIITPDYEATWSKILSAMRTESRRDPAGFGRRALDEAVAFSSLLAMRGRHAIIARLKAWDRGRVRFGSDEQEPVLDDSDLPRLLELERHLAALVESRAAAERRWGLARRNGAPCGCNAEAGPSPTTGGDDDDR